MKRPSLHERIDQLIAGHIQSLGSGRFVRRADIEACLDIIDPKTHVLVLTRYAPRGARSGSGNHQLVHRLSFERKHGHMRQLPREAPGTDSALRRYEALLRRRGIAWQHPLVLLIPDVYSFPENERVRIQQHLNVLVTQTQIWRNIQKDHSISIVHEFSRRARSVLERPNGMTLRDLCEKLAEQFGGTAAIATRRLAEEESAAAFSKFMYRQGPFKVFLCRGNLSQDRQRIERILNSDSIQHLCKEALQRAKVIDATDDANAIAAGDPFSHFLILPFSRSTDTKARRLELIVLIDKERKQNSLCYMDVLAAQEIVPLSNNVNLKTQGKILSDLTHMLAHLHAHPDVYWSKSPDTQFRKIASNLSELLVRATRAHSSTFRIIDASRRNLVKIASSNGIQVGLREIPLELANRSLNAFTYHHFQSFDGFCYVPIVNCIPPELSSKGFEHCLACHPQTQSEICLAIVHGVVAVGTISLESSSLHGFDEDLSFLRTATLLMSSIYATLVDLYDSRFISQQLSSLNQHHELKNHIDFLARKDPPFASFLMDKYLPGLSPKRGRPGQRPRHATFTVRELVDEAKEIFNVHGQATLNDLDVHINPAMPTINAEHHYRVSLVQVIEQLISNMINHSSTLGPRNSSLNIDYEPRAPRTENRRVSVFPTQLLRYGFAGGYRENILIVMKYSINTPLSALVAQNLGQRAVRNPQSGQKRFGFYILGLIVRKLGGVVQPVHDPATLKTQVTITIPLTLKDQKWK